MRIPKLISLLLVILYVTGCPELTAQVTTSTISGNVSGPDGKPLSGATVQISFENAGINKLTTTQSNGSFLVPNLRVGGPYKVTVTYTGFQEKTTPNIYLELGQNTP